MRQWIDLFEGQRLSAYLQGTFYHGTSRENFAFRPSAPAYFTQSYEQAREFAWMDSEIDGETPYVLHCKLHVTNPAFLDCILMQDLHLGKHAGLVADLIAQGHDCAMAENLPDHDEIVVFGASKIEVINPEQIPFRDEINEACGKIVKGVNTTCDVGVNQTSIEAAKFGNSVDQNGVPTAKLFK